MQDSNADVKLFLISTACSLESKDLVIRLDFGVPHFFPADDDLLLKMQVQVQGIMRLIGYHFEDDGELEQS